MKVLSGREELSALIQEMRLGGKRVGFVPTMGGLHAGHMSLVARSKDECDITVVSVFLNPTQFNDPKDLETYPHNTDDDLKLLEHAGVDVAFVPEPSEMYEDGEEAPDLPLGRVAEVMEGEKRPGHFRGVVWIVSKLFRLVLPDRAYFGLKDFQQIAVIRRMIDLLPDLHGIQIVPCPVVREADGLAMSSRNRKLNAEERAAAPKIYQALVHGKSMMESGATVVQVHNAILREINSSPLLEVEYLRLVDSKTLEEVQDWSGSVTACITVWCGDNTRLIDHLTYVP